MKTILIVTNVCTVFSLALAQLRNRFFVTMHTMSSDIPKKFGISLAYYKNSEGIDPLQELADKHKLQLCTEIFNSRFFIMNDQYEEYKDILNKIQAAVQKNPVISQGLSKEISVTHESFPLKEIWFVYLCFSDDSMELYISTDFANVNNFFLYSYIRGSYEMSESSQVTLLAYAAPNPLVDYTINYGLEMLYFTQRNKVTENNKLMENKLRPWYPNSLRLCAAGYAYKAGTVSLGFQICKVKRSTVHRKSIELTVVKDGFYYNLYVMRCHVLCISTNISMDYYFTPDFHDNSSVFYLSPIIGQYFRITGRISGIPLR